MTCFFLSLRMESSNCRKLLIDGLSSRRAAAIQRQTRSREVLRRASGDDWGFRGEGGDSQSRGDGAVVGGRDRGKELRDEGDPTGVEGDRKSLLEQREGEEDAHAGECPAAEDGVELVRPGGSLSAVAEGGSDRSGQVVVIRRRDRAGIRERRGVRWLLQKSSICGEAARQLGSSRPRPSDIMRRNSGRGRGSTRSH